MRFDLQLLIPGIFLLAVTMLSLINAVVTGDARDLPVDAILGGVGLFVAILSVDGWLPRNRYTH